jgi:hypothetical protein
MSPVTTNPIVDDVAIERDQQLVVENEEGSFFFRYIGPDGSLTCWGGSKGHESWRNFRADRCHLPGWRPAAVVDAEVAEKSSRAARYSAFEMWAGAHQNEVFTTSQLTDISGFSTPTLLKYLESSLIFEKVKRGTWRVRDLTKSRS